MYNQKLNITTINKNFKINFIKRNELLKKINNIINKLSLPLFIAIISLITLIIIFSNNIYNKSKIKNNIFRIHIVANSNSIEDQILKHKINEKVLNYINKINKNYNMNSFEYLNLIKENINELSKIINSTIKENNKTYKTAIKLGNIKYEKKENINYSMKEDTYTSMQILIGDAKGKNVWNLIFPNKENIHKLKYLNNILPGIENIFENQ